MNVCTSVVLDFVTSRALCRSSLIASITPRSRASMSAATETALYKLSGPSALNEVAGRIEPVSTTGRSDVTVRCRKYPVSSAVSVPCVMTTPSVSSPSNSLLMRFASPCQMTSSMSWLLICANCSPVTSPSAASPGTLSISCSIMTEPGR